MDNLKYQMKKAKLKTEKTQQFLILPEEIHLEGEEFYIKQIGNTIVLISVDNPYQPLWDSLGLFSDDFMDKQ
jgi:antitoxin VapB